MFNLKGPQGQNPRTTCGPRSTVWETLPQTMNFSYALYLRTPYDFSQLTAIIFLTSISWLAVNGVLTNAGGNWTSIFYLHQIRTSNDLALIVYRCTVRLRITNTDHHFSTSVYQFPLNLPPLSLSGGLIPIKHPVFSWLNCKSAQLVLYTVGPRCSGVTVTSSLSLTESYVLLSQVCIKHQFPLKGIAIALKVSSYVYLPSQPCRQVTVTNLPSYPHFSLTNFHPFESPAMPT